MVEFMSEFYDKAGVDPKEVPFVEAYGSAQKASYKNKSDQNC